jgi:hypothetical protein
MTYSEKAINKAIEGWWIHEAIRVDPRDGENYLLSEAESEAFLDPSFWQSIGRAMGWNEHDGEIPHPAREVSRVVGGKVQKYRIIASVAHRTFKSNRWKKRVASLH